jgi:hypothetical protein
VPYRWRVCFVREYLAPSLPRYILEVSSVVLCLELDYSLQILLRWIFALFNLPLKFLKIRYLTLFDVLFNLIHLKLQILCFLLLLLLSWEPTISIRVRPCTCTVQNSPSTPPFLLDDVGDRPSCCVPFVVLRCLFLTLFRICPHELSHLWLNVLVLFFVLKCLIKIVCWLPSSRYHKLFPFTFHNINLFYFSFNLV